MTDKKEKITGYRELDQNDINVINEIKAIGKSLEMIIDGLQLYEGVDKRWLSIAKTHLQQGLMAAVRSVAKPESF